MGGASGTAAEKTLLVRLGKAASEITTRLESGVEDGIQSGVKELTDSNELLFWAMIDGDSLIKAHAAEGFIGHNSPANLSATQSSEMIERVSCLHENGTGGARLLDSAPQ